MYFLREKYLCRRKACHKGQRRITRKGETYNCVVSRICSNRYAHSICFHQQLLNIHEKISCQFSSENKILVIKLDTWRILKQKEKENKHYSSNLKIKSCLSLRNPCFHTNKIEIVTPYVKFVVLMKLVNGFDKNSQPFCIYFEIKWFSNLSRSSVSHRCSRNFRKTKHF